MLDLNFKQLSFILTPETGAQGDCFFKSSPEDIVFMAFREKKRVRQRERETSHEREICIGCFSYRP